MNHYIEITIACADSDMAEVAMAYLADYPFDSFDTEERDETTLLKGYILESEWLTCQDEARNVAAEYGSSPPSFRWLRCASSPIS